MDLPDHVFVFAFAVVYPIAGFVGFRRLIHRIRAGEPVNRGNVYSSTIFWHWLLFVLSLITWSMSDRRWALLGFEVRFDLRFGAGAVLTMACIMVLVAQLRQAGSFRDEDLEHVRNQMGELSLLIPRNRTELGRFNVLSITAGIVEETLWRGYLIWYLSVAMPVWGAAIISAVGFGIAHAYQGAANLPKIVLVGGLFSGLYLLTGSLWLPMLLHATVDLLQGRLGYQVMRRTEQGTLA